MKTNEFKTLINKIEKATKGGEFTKLENKLWNEQTFLTNAQLRKALQKLFARESEVGGLSLSSHHTALKTLAQSLERTAGKQPAKRSDEEIAHDVAIELAQIEQKKGGKHMSNKKKETPADVQPAQTTETPVEVLKGEVIDTKNETEINAAIDRIASKVENIGKGYLDIVGDVARLRKYEAWKLTGHKSLYALCADKFGMARGTVANLEAVFKKYGDPETFTLTDACAGMSLRAMLAEIDAEKKAAIEDKNGTPAEDGDGEAPADSKKKGKVETLVSITWELAGDDWNAEAILEQIAKQLAETPDAKEAFPDGACVTFTITK